MSCLSDLNRLQISLQNCSFVSGARPRSKIAILFREPAPSALGGAHWPPYKFCSPSEASCSKCTFGCNCKLAQNFASQSPELLLLLRVFARAQERLCIRFALELQKSAPWPHFENWDASRIWAKFAAFSRRVQSPVQFFR